MRWRRSDGPIKVPPGTCQHILSLAHPGLPGERALGVTAIATALGLPPPAVGAFLSSYNKQVRLRQVARRQAQRLSDKADKARLPRPLYTRDSQDNPIPNPRTRHDNNPLTPGEACHTLPTNCVDPDFIAARYTADP